MEWNKFSMSNLRLINETTATSSASVSATDIFSADFDIYKIVINDIDQISSGGFINQTRFINSSGSIVTSANYDNALLQIKAYGGFGELIATNQTKMDLMTVITGGAEVGQGTVIYVFNPFNSSSYTFLISQGGAKRSANTLITKSISVLKQTSSITGFQLLPNTSDVDNASIRTYGLRVDS